MKAIILVCFTLAVSQAQLLVGGYRKVDDHDPEVLNVASFAERELNARSNSLQTSRITKLVSASRQVVNGFNYKLKFEFTKTVCDKRNNQDLQTCDLTNKVETCEVTIYKSIQGAHSLSSHKCSGTASKRQLAGGISGPVSDPESYKSHVLKAIESTNAGVSNVKIIEVRTQVVAGQMLRMKIEGTQAGKNKVCNIKVWTRPWLPEGENFKVQEFNCVDKIETRQVCAGCKKDVENPEEYKGKFLLAANAANRLFDEQNVKVVSVQTQVVSGIRYIMKVQVGQNQVCDVDFVEAPWRSPPVSILKFEC